MIRSVLVGLNGTTYTPSVLDHGLALLHGTRGEVTALTLFPGEDPAGGAIFASTGSLQAARLGLGRGERQQLRQIRADGEAFARRCRDAGHLCHLQSDRQEPELALRRAMRFVDCTVLGPGGWSELDEIDDPFVSLAELLPQIPGPLLCSTDTYRPVRQVLIGLGTSDEACRMWRALLALDPWPEARFRVLVTVAKDERALGEAMLEGALQYARLAGHRACDGEVVGGAVDEILLARAAAYDALVIAQARRSGWQRFLHGDLAGRVLHESPVSVLVLP